MKFIFYICLTLLITACNSTHKNSFIKHDSGDIHILPSETLYLKTPDLNAVHFQGHFNYDKIDIKGGNMGYPADNGAMFLTSILTHAMMASANNESVMSETQLQANKVLEPYSAYLHEFEHGELVSCIIQSIDEIYDFRVTPYTDKNILSGWLLKSEPIFFMTQDQRELVLKHAMYVHHVNEPENILYKNIIEITSRKVDDEDLIGYWVGQNKLPLVSGQLYARSIELFIDDMLDKNKGLNEKQKTFRYQQGGKKNYERGSLVKNECGETTIRTLRGWLKSFPSTDASSDKACNKKLYVDLKTIEKI